MPFIACYRSTDSARTLLGGVKQGVSSRFESRADAELRLQCAIEIHAGLNPPAVVGEVIEVHGYVDIFADGSIRGGSWGKGKGKRRN